MIVTDSLFALRNRSERARIVQHTSIMLGTFFFSAFVKQLVEELDLFDLECKLGMFRVRLSFHCVLESVFVQVICENKVMKT